MEAALGTQLLMLCFAPGAGVSVLLAPPQHVLLPGNLVALMCLDKSEMLKYFCDNPEYQSRGVPVRRNHSLQLRSFLQAGISLPVVAVVLFQLLQ